MAVEDRASSESRKLLAGPTVTWHLGLPDSHDNSPASSGGSSSISWSGRSSRSDDWLRNSSRAEYPHSDSTTNGASPAASLGEPMRNHHVTASPASLKACGLDGNALPGVSRAGQMHSCGTLAPAGNPGPRHGVTVLDGVGNARVSAQEPAPNRKLPKPKPGVALQEGAVGGRAGARGMPVEGRCVPAGLSAKGEAVDDEGLGMAGTPLEGVAGGRGGGAEVGAGGKGEGVEGGLPAARKGSDSAAGASESTLQGASILKGVAGQRGGSTGLPEEGAVLSPDSMRNITLEQWRELLTDEQQMAFSSLRADQAVIEETLRLRQQQIHFQREEGEVAMLKATSARQLEEEQAREMDELIALQDSEREMERDTRNTRSLLSAHFQKRVGEQAERRQLQAAHKLLQHQLRRMQHAREGFNFRMQQREDRYQRERRELAAANSRKLRNEQVGLQLQLRHLSREKQEGALKNFLDELSHTRVLQAKEADQLREMQLLQLRHSTRAFEYDQACMLANYELEALQLEATQRLEKDQSAEMSALRSKHKMTMADFRQVQRTEHQKLVANNLLRKQKGVARKLQLTLAKEAALREQSRRAQMESDFVEFLTVLQAGTGLSDSSATSSTKFSLNDTLSTFSGNPNEQCLEGNSAEELVASSQNSATLLESLCSFQEDEERRKTQVQEAAVKQLAEVHSSMVAALQKEHRTVREMLLKKQKEGAKTLQGDMESEVKATKTAHVMEKQQLVEAQEAALEKGREALRLEKELAKMSKEHQQNLQDYLNFICHELRNPLCAITGFVELVQMHPSATGMHPEVEEFLQSMLNQASLMRRIVNDVLDLSKIEEGKFQLQSHPFSLRQVIEEVVVAQHSFELSLRNTISAPRLSQSLESARQAVTSSRFPLEISCNVDPALPSKVVGDATRMRQIVTNLVSNAIKFTLRGHVRVILQVVGRNADKIPILCEVEDTGPGIRPQDQAKLFGKFHQLTNATTNIGMTTGSGLGLCICKTLVDSMEGGSIGVRSTGGGGSTFWFRVTLQVAPTKPGRDGRSPAKPSGVPQDDVVGANAQEGVQARSGEVGEQTLSHHPHLHGVAAETLGHRPSISADDFTSHDNSEVNSTAIGPVDQVGGAAAPFTTTDGASCSPSANVSQDDLCAIDVDSGTAAQQEHDWSRRSPGIESHGAKLRESHGVRPWKTHGARHGPSSVAQEPGGDATSGWRPRVDELASTQSHLEGDPEAEGPGEGGHERTGGTGQGWRERDQRRPSFSYGDWSVRSSGGSEGINEGGHQTAGEALLEQQLDLGDLKEANSGPGEGWLDQVCKERPSGPSARMINRVAKPLAECQVLLAEDNQTLRKTTAAMLWSVGVRHLDVAWNGEEALNMFTRKDYDIGVLDIQMPVSTGTEVAQSLRKGGFKGVLIACTANAMQSQIDHYHACGFDMSLCKPFNMKDLTELMEYITNPTATEKIPDGDGYVVAEEAA